MNEMTLAEAKQEILRLRKENHQLKLAIEAFKEAQIMASARDNWERKYIRDNWEREFLRSQIPENHEMGQ